MDFVGPFLRIIVDGMASGPITAVALMSISHLLTNNVLGLLDSRVSQSMHDIVAAVRHCKFEATDPAHDQMVLCKILQTLCTCLHCPTGRHLSDDDVCAVFQSAYRIGFDTQIVLELSGTSPSVIGYYDRRLHASWLVITLSNSVTTAIHIDVKNA